jgi:hypothetical protein
VKNQIYPGHFFKIKIQCQTFYFYEVQNLNILQVFKQEKSNICLNSLFCSYFYPMRIRVTMRIRDRVGPPHPHVCCKRRLNEVTHPVRPEKPVSCHRSFGTINITFCSSALSVEHRPTFCSSSPAMVISPYKWKILDRDVKQ